MLLRREYMSLVPIGVHFLRLSSDRLLHQPIVLVVKTLSSCQFHHQSFGRLRRRRRNHG
jgi:hypothetical protein